MRPGLSTQALPVQLDRIIVPTVSALLLGLFVVFAVGFAGPDVVHAAAHDARHAFAFPCH
jgi:cobalt transporter subunit CbtB